MHNCSPRESAFRRAIKDTISAQKSVRFMWGGEGVLAVAGGAWLAACAPTGAPVAEFVWRSVAGGLIGLVVAFIVIFLICWITAPYNICRDAKNKLQADFNVLNERVQVLENERIPQFTVKPDSYRRQYDHENPHLMWAELQVTNTSHSITLRNVGVQIASCIEVLPITEKNNPNITYHLYDRETWSRVSVLWSELDVSPAQTEIDIPPGSTKTALIAFQDDSNGLWTVFNAPIAPPRPRNLGGAKIDIEVSSIDSALWRGSYYIECHPNYVSGAQARFEFVEWETWITSHKITNLLSTPDNGDSQT